MLLLCTEICSTHKWMDWLVGKSVMPTSWLIHKKKKYNLGLATFKCSQKKHTLHSCDLSYKLLNTQWSLELLALQHLKGYSPPRNYSALIWQKVQEHDLLVPKPNRSKFPMKHALWEYMGFTPAGWEIWEPKEDMTVREDTWQVPELQLREVFHKTGQFIKSSQILPAYRVS